MRRRTSRRVDCDHPEPPLGTAGVRKKLSFRTGRDRVKWTLKIASKARVNRSHWMTGGTATKPATPRVRTSAPSGGQGMCRLAPGLLANPTTVHEIVSDGVAKPDRAPARSVEWRGRNHVVSAPAPVIPTAKSDAPNAHDAGPPYVAAWSGKISGAPSHAAALRLSQHRRPGDLIDDCQAARFPQRRDHRLSIATDGTIVAACKKTRTQCDSWEVR
jgi:hypothetical protein